MGFSSIWHWIIVLVVILLLFGAGKIPRLMGDVAKGVKAFKKGMADDDEPATTERKAIDEKSGTSTVEAPAPSREDASKG